MVNAFQLKKMPKPSYFNHCKKIYLEMRTFYDANVTSPRQNIKNVYECNFNVRQNYANGKKIKLAVCTDGSYSQHGNHSVLCINFIFECITGEFINFEMTEKCLRCPNAKKLNTCCPYELFHGDSGGMEVHNTKFVFERALQHDFMYTEIV